MAPANSVIKHHQLGSFLSSAQPDTIPGFFIIHGEPYLIKQAFDTLSSFLLGPDHSPFALETLEGGSVSIGDIIEQVSTFSFLVPQKIVAVKNIPLFQAPQGSQDISFSSSDIEHLAQFLDAGLPANHFLILTTPHIDKRKKIYKKMADNGCIIDCSVASGVRKADTDEQKSVLQQVGADILSTVGKTIDNKAFHALVEMTGFNLDLFSQNLEKLIVYSGKASRILITDVKAVIIRDKKDPIFNLTNAVLDKDVNLSITYLNSLFNDGFHPLQILKSFENLIRKLILVKCFIQDVYQHTPVQLKKMNFNSFKQVVLPKIVQHDQQTMTDYKTQDEYLTSNTVKKKKDPPNDLLLAPNPKNPYPVFQVFQKAENFSLNELNQAVFFLSDLDYRLKSSSFDAKTQIENFIINICRKGGEGDAEKDKNRRHHF
ncbi:DNA polymerase III subunit delta [Desulfobacula sp.]|uniref:DNA polymerase III subunit delta n=1 Tax=Desulfobacula sp. TaxID=2593537 RepID=UPI002617B177|nr:DNA polymerase III subunit delta [Desulfobacula sp.]